jgi:hypothetical protein
MKIQTEIPEKYLYFLNVPEQYKNFRIVNYGLAGTWLMEIDSSGLNNWKVILPPYSKYEILGFVSDVIISEINTDKNFVLRIM